MEDEIRKKKDTDCVYFLASPLTCKKGSECEFRHSETARLNPRDCWYWLNGTCLNPTCAFRHPPLKGFEETSSDVTHSSAVEPTSKANVPCYFFFNAYCVKGDHCPFSHGNDMFIVQKTPKAINESTSLQPQEKKVSNGSDTGPASVEAPPFFSDCTSTDMVPQKDTEVVLGNSAAPDNIIDELSSSPVLSIPDCDEPTAAKLSGNPGSAGEYADGRAQSPSDQSSEEPEKCCNDPDELLESSPGFDVLVDDGSDHLACEDDGEYQLVREGRLLNYDYEGAAAGYDPTYYPDIGFLHEHGSYDDSYDKNEVRKYEQEGPDYIQDVSEHAKERVLDDDYTQQRPHSRNQKNELRNQFDLRHQLRKRRRVDCHHSPRGSQRHYSPFSRGGSQERQLSHCEYFPRQNPLEVRKNIFGPSRSVVMPNFNERRSWVEYAEHSRHLSRQQERESRRRVRQGQKSHLSSEISKCFGGNETRPNKDASFTAPKSLAQIKEEKRRAIKETHELEDAASFQQNAVSSTEFLGPKPLEDLLKDKRKSVSATKGSANMCGNGFSDDKEDGYHHDDYDDYDDCEGDDVLFE